jgi:hypothetical protein
MDVTAPSGSGFEVNAHSQGVFRVTLAPSFIQYRLESGDWVELLPIVGPPC